ncbi:hypothetical protein NM688_g8746 [Phlebia brevispora]|uniref:Uncharacterized protein n=1 Tax=Phlebia brevispora TaxID=194682 RepID=A0ACC1RPN5_9APHY|nr:hypothetical protein NM688_g8746 [Phlebia brevispora]
MASLTHKRSWTGSPTSYDFDLDTEPMSKRTRTDEEVEEMLEPESPGSSEQSVELSYEQQKPVRDEAYYMQDGSCVLRVENTLFNIHRTVLAKDNSLFSSMFELPQGEHETEGLTDDCPIILQGDTVQEFRHLLWVLYAL